MGPRLAVVRISCVWLGWFAAALLSVAADDAGKPKPAAGQNAETNVHDAYLQEVATLLRQGKFDRLEAISAQLLRDKPEFPSGMRKVTMFYAGLSKDSDKARADEFQQVIAKLEAWGKAKPQSATALIALAAAYVDFAWHARGSAVAARVTPQGWKLFGERLKTAEELLDKADTLHAKDPQLYVVWMIAGRGLNYARPKMDALLADATALDPDWDPPYRQMAVYLQPHWHGQAGDLEQFADQTAEATRSRSGMAMYSVVVETAAQSFGINVFDTFKLSWEQARQGFEQRLKRHPASQRLLSRYAAVACAAEDRPQAQRLFAKLDPSPSDLSCWRSAQVFSLWRNWSRPDYFQGQQRAVAGGHHGAIEGVAYTPGNPTMLLTAGANGRFLFRDPDTAQQLQASPRVDWALSCIAVSAKPIRVATGGSGNLRLWSLAEGDRAFGGVRGLRQVALSIDGRFLAAAESWGKAHLWDLSSEAEPRVLDASSSSKQVYGVQFSPDGKLLATCAGDGMIKLWDPASGKLQRQWSAHKGKTLAAVFTSDGKRLFSGGADNRLRLWEVESAKQLADLGEAPYPISCLALSSDGNRLAAGTRRLASPTEPCSLLVWDTARKKLLAQLKGHKGTITGVAIAPDGKTIASTSSDMTVRLWAMPDAIARPKQSSPAESAPSAPPRKPPKSQPAVPAAPPK